jgi:hypothetical protein
MFMRDASDQNGSGLKPMIQQSAFGSPKMLTPPHAMTRSRSMACAIIRQRIAGSGGTAPRHTPRPVTWKQCYVIITIFFRFSPIFGKNFLCGFYGNRHFLPVFYGENISISCNNIIVDLENM